MRDITTNRVGLEVLAIVISAITLLTTVGGWIWYGGRLSQRVDMLSEAVAQVRTDTNATRDINAQQNSEIAVTRSQYVEIINRLNRIDAKLDIPRR